LDGDCEAAHFVFWDNLLPDGCNWIRLAYLSDRKFKGHGVWTTII